MKIAIVVAFINIIILIVLLSFVTYILNFNSVTSSVVLSVTCITADLHGKKACAMIRIRLSYAETTMLKFSQILHKVNFIFCIFVVVLFV